VVVLGIVGALAFVTLLLTAFGSGAPERAVSTSIEPSVIGAGPNVAPEPQVLATVSNLQITLPVAADAVTAIGFHSARGGAVELQPAGRQANEGLLARLWRRIAGSSQASPVWYQLDGGPGTNVLDVGAAPGTDVFAPVDGTVAAISAYVIDGKQYGSQIDVRPSAAPSVIVSLTHLRPDESLAVGSTVIGTATKLGTVVDVAAVERQALARHARARGNNVAIEVHPAAGSLP
jgi:hypothetical protein